MLYNIIIIYYWLWVIGLIANLTNLTLKKVYIIHSSVEYHYSIIQNTVDKKKNVFKTIRNRKLFFSALR